MKPMQQNHSPAAAMNATDMATPWDSEKEKRMDDMLIRTIQGLDVFIAESNRLSIGTIARVLHNAKEELVYWAANLDYNETRAEAFINRLLYTNSLFTSMDSGAKPPSRRNGKTTS